MPIRYIALVFVFLAGSILGVFAQDQPATYVVVGVTEASPLNVRSGPGEKYRVIAKLKNGEPGVQITGPPVMNGKDDWVPIIISGIGGWVRPRYLERVWPVASLPEDSSSPATDADPTLNSLQKMPAREPAKPSDLFEKEKPAPNVKHRPVTTDSDSGFGWFILMIIAFFVVAAAKKGKKQPARANQCPACLHDTLQTHKRLLWGGSYRYCTRFWCGYNEDKIEKERERRQRIEGHRSDVLIEQQRQRERNERDAQERERRGY
jgi:hypothetical protein